MNTNATCTCNCKKCRKIIETLKNPKKQPLTISTMNTAIIYWLYSGIKNMISIQQPLFTMWLFKNSTTKILKMVNRLSKGILNEFPLGIFLYVPFERLHLLVVIKKKKNIALVTQCQTHLEMNMSLIEICTPHTDHHKQPKYHYLYITHISR